jgi:putative nucleotidyltransferase with HDIG domain
VGRDFASRRPAGYLERQDISWPRRARVLIAWALGILLSVAILVIRLPLGGKVALQVGYVATADVVAPRQATYVSEILTQQRRDLAANAVSDVYDPPQTRVVRQQLAAANRILDSIAAARSDSSSVDLSTRVSQIEDTASISIAPGSIERVLTMTQEEWERVASEIQVVLDRAMREEIRENNLADERRKVAARVRLDLSDEDAAIVVRIVQDLVVPNSFPNTEKTEQRRQEARDAVEPVTAAVARNEIILRAGDIATPLDIEALDALGLRLSRWSWKEASLAAVFILLLGILLFYYLWRQEPQLWLDQTKLLVLLLLLLFFLLAARLVLPAGTVASYLFPYAALAMILGVLLNLRVAFISAALFALLAGWLTGNSLEMVVYVLSGSVLGALKLRRGERLASFAWAAGYVVGANLLVLIVFRLGGSGLNARDVAELVLAAVGNGLLAMTLTLVGVYLLGSLPGMTTSLHLLEISRPTHPLLRQLLLKAPGTYHHTLIVSNMAERAAEAIGADSLLARVGAYYHDVGKTIRPYFFVENRDEGMDDPHARLDPYTSAQMIIGHVKDGIELARKYRLPRQITDFIPEHHGTMLAPYFYREAVKQAGGAQEKVDKSQFAYPGPKPRSRETAITMLADGAEATVRSKRPSSIDELEQIVSDAMQSRLLAGQLDESPLTMEDLSAVQRAFVDVLRGLQHPRIDYPAEVTQERPVPGDEDVHPTQPAVGNASPEPGGQNGKEGADAPESAPTGPARPGS